MIHRLVNTTPKPRATKKSSGELVGPFPLLFPLSVVVAAGGDDVVADAVDMITSYRSCGVRKDQSEHKRFWKGMFRRQRAGLRIGDNW